MNKQDFEVLSLGDKNMLREARQALGIEVVPDVSVPKGYVQNRKTGTIYELDTWLRKVRQGLVDANDGIIA